MKKTILSTLIVGSACVFGSHLSMAEETGGTTARIAALEKENAAMRRENAALRENARLRQQNASLKSANAVPAPSAAQPPATSIKPSVFDAYAADLPVTYKARPVETRGEFRVWGEGGAFWSGGDSNTLSHNLTDFRTTVLLGNVLGSTVPATIDLTPKVGWEGAGGFDYRFANSLWHVSGQFRYGESGKGGSSLSSSGSLDPALLGYVFGGDPAPAGFSSNGSQTFNASYKETHWIGDLAVGHDIVSNGRESMQVKLGVRVAELVGTTNTQDNINYSTNLGTTTNIFGTPVSSLDLTTSTATQIRNSYVGAGPRIGVEGSVPLAGNWAFDYLGDAAVLFGNQKQTSTSSSSSVTNPAILGLLFGNGSSSVSTDQRYATVFNADIQVGVSYWMTQNVKLSASYRLDAFVGATDNLSTSSIQAINRYIHGPHFGISATF